MRTEHPWSEGKSKSFVPISRQNIPGARRYFGQRLQSTATTLHFQMQEEIKEYMKKEMFGADCDLSLAMRISRQIGQAKHIHDMTLIVE